MVLVLKELNLFLQHELIKSKSLKLDIKSNNNHSEGNVNSFRSIKAQKTECLHLDLKNNFFIT